ncbi:MAG: response regulator transcription factor [Actinomycetota bacterium]
MATILLVDDDEDIRFLHQIVLKTAGYETVLADGGKSVLDMLAAGHRPDLIVLDVQMADLDGWAVLQAVREHEGTSHIPVIMCTVKSGPRDLARGWRMGCDGYILKPFNINDLTGQVAVVLRRSPAERELTRQRALAELEELMRLG